MFRNSQIFYIVIHPVTHPVKDEWLFDPAQLSYHLISSGLDTARINMPFTQKPYVAGECVTTMVFMLWLLASLFL